MLKSNLVAGQVATEKFDLAAAYKVTGGTSTGQNASGGSKRNRKHGLHVFDVLKRCKKLHESDKGWILINQPGDGKVLM